MKVISCIVFIVKHFLGNYVSTHHSSIPTTFHTVNMNTNVIVCNCHLCILENYKWIYCYAKNNTVCTMMQTKGAFS